MLESWSLVVSIFAAIVVLFSVLFSWWTSKQINVVKIKHERAKSLIHFCSCLRLNDMNWKLRSVKDNREKFNELHKYTELSAEECNENKEYFNDEVRVKLKNLFFKNLAYFEESGEGFVTYFHKGYFEKPADNDASAKKFIYPQIENDYKPVLKYSEGFKSKSTYRDQM